MFGGIYFSTGSYFMSDFCCYLQWPISYTGERKTIWWHLLVFMFDWSSCSLPSWSDFVCHVFGRSRPSLLLLVGSCSHLVHDDGDDLAPSDDNQAEMVFEGHPCSKLGLGDQHIYIYIYNYIYIFIYNYIYIFIIIYIYIYIYIYNNIYIYL